jgi:hypothetical protein
VEKLTFMSLRSTPPRIFFDANFSQLLMQRARRVVGPALSATRLFVPLGINKVNPGFAGTVRNRRNRKKQNLPLMNADRRRLKELLRRKRVN